MEHFYEASNTLGNLKLSPLFWADMYKEAGYAHLIKYNYGTPTQDTKTTKQQMKSHFSTCIHLYIAYIAPLSNLKKPIAQQPELLSIYSNLAQAHFHTGNYGSAMTYYINIDYALIYTNVDSSFLFTIHCGRAAVYLKQKQYKKALEYSQKALEYKQAASTLALAEMHHDMGLHLLAPRAAKQRPS